MLTFRYSFRLGPRAHGPLCTFQCGCVFLSAFVSIAELSCQNRGGRPLWVICWVAECSPTAFVIIMRFVSIPGILPSHPFVSAKASWQSSYPLWEYHKLLLGPHKSSWQSLAVSLMLWKSSSSKVREIEERTFSFVTVIQSLFTMASFRIGLRLNSVKLN